MKNKNNRYLHAFSLAEVLVAKRVSDKTCSQEFARACELKAPTKIINKLYAFTLAEVLITLAIIGVVAALTIPTVVKNYEKRQIVTQLKKFYSVMSQATNMVILEHGNPTKWTIENSPDGMEQLFLMFKPYLSVIKTCNNVEGCWSSALTKALNPAYNATYATLKGIGANGIYTFILKDGVAVTFDSWNTLNLEFGVYTLKFAVPTPMLAVDLNGAKPPNQIGKDVFYFVFTQNGLTPAGTSNKSVYCKKDYASTFSGADCAAKVLKEGDITYW